jgi:hypothetical protein
MLNSLEEIASDSVLDEAYAWLCKRRENYSHNDEVWEVRFRWKEVKPWLQGQLLAGRYRFTPLRRIHRINDDLEIWSALDALLLKAMAIVLTRWSSRSRSACSFSGWDAERFSSVMWS